MAADGFRVDESGRGALDDLEAQVRPRHELEHHVQHPLRTERERGREASSVLLAVLFKESENDFVAIFRTILLQMVIAWVFYVLQFLCGILPSSN